MPEALQRRLPILIFWVLIVFGALSGCMDRSPSETDVPLPISSLATRRPYGANEARVDGLLEGFVHRQKNCIVVDGTNVVQSAHAAWPFGYSMTNEGIVDSSGLLVARLDSFVRLQGGVQEWATVNWATVDSAECRGGLIFVVGSVVSKPT
jgi:hypothetical protein